jgi:transcriptional regulator with GAF, ATPase, and Fis domain
VPPLRERRDDIAMLAASFAQKFAQRMGRTLEPIAEECLRRLQSYSWPGNVRELQNIIERAVITSHNGRLNLDRALPESSGAAAAAFVTDGAAVPRVRTAKELEELERANIVAALEAADWKVAGEKGAAQLLGVKPTTLSSRIKALGISRRN